MALGLAALAAYGMQNAFSWMMQEKQPLHVSDDTKVEYCVCHDDDGETRKSPARKHALSAMDEQWGKLWVVTRFAPLALEYKTHP